jgi:IS30 family transposase
VLHRFEQTALWGSLRRSCFATVPNTHQEMVAAAFRSIFALGTASEAAARWDAADATRDTLAQILGSIEPCLARTLTWDQGREMTRHAELTRDTGAPVYLADPHSPWQRPPNENGNGLLRRYFPKGTDLSLHMDGDLCRVEQRLNTMPRRSIDWDCTLRLYDAAVAMTG